MFFPPWNIPFPLTKAPTAINPRRAFVLSSSDSVPPIADNATHSVQLPGGKGICSGGEKQYVASLARSAIAFGCDGLFLEVHQNPTQAPCDSSNMISLEKLASLLPIVLELDKSILKNKLR